MVMETNQRTILDTYRLFYPERKTVIDSEFLLLLGHSSQYDRTGNLPSLAWPPPAYDEELRTDAFWETIASRLETEPEHYFTLIEVVRELVLRLVHKTYLDGKSSMEIAALCNYRASCLKDISISGGEIASATGVSEVAVRSLFARFYPHRQDLIRLRAFNEIGRADSLGRRSRSLPPERQPSAV